MQRTDVLEQFAGVGSGSRCRGGGSRRGRTRGCHRSRERGGGWGTKLAKEQGIDADADDVYRWFTRHPEWYGPKDPAIARVLADKSGETIDWLQEMGVPFLKEVGPLFGYTELPVIHHVDGKGAEMVRVLAEAAEKAGVGTLTDTSATKLVADADGRVIGVEAVQKKNPVRIKANKGVVMATGSFAGSTAMIGQMNAECANLLPGSNPEHGRRPGHGHGAGRLHHARLGHAADELVGRP